MNPLSTALTNIRRSPIQSLTAVVIVTVTMFVAFTFSLLVLGTQEILQYFETRPQVIGFFELETPLSEIQVLKSEMEKKVYVNQTKLITQEEALATYREANQDDPLLLELVTADILPASLEVSADRIEDLAKIRNDLESEPNIEEVVFQQDIIEQLTNWTRSVRSIGLAAVAVLAITSFLIMTALISMKVAQRKQAIRIMKLIGANNWFVKAPFFFEGALYGLTGSLIGWTGMYASLLYMTPWLKDFLGNITLFPIPAEVFALQLGAGTVIAVILGSFAGTTAAQRILK